MSAPNTLTVLGLGPGAPGQLTVESRDLLAAAPEVWARTGRHPTLAALAPGRRLHTFDDLYETLPTFEAVYKAIAERLLELARRPEGAVFAVPGHPLVGEASVRLLLNRAPAEGIRLALLPGMSFVEPALVVLGLDPVAAGLQIVDALDARLSPDRPALVAQIYDRRTASSLKLALLDLYPPDHAVTLLYRLGLREGEERRDVTLAELDRHEDFDHLTTLYVPPLPVERNLRTFDGFRAIVARLRGPGGCPWDRRQTHQSLRKYLLEEAYEALEAIDGGDAHALEEELGDLLLQVFLQAQIAEDEGEFAATDVVAGIAAKIVRRHPHVFGDVSVRSAEEVAANWQALKDRERAERGQNEGLLASVPSALPALALSQSLQSRAATAGFDWPDVQGVLDKVTEELAELARAEGEERRDEFGDLLFSLVNYARHRGIDAEEALRLAGGRFRRRFEEMERQAAEQGLEFQALGLAALDALWDEAKARERAPRDAQ